MSIPDLYAILGVEKKATQEEIKKAFRRLAKELHPDTNKAPDAEQKFKEIKEAYNIIGEEESRREYDEDVARGGELRQSYSPSFNNVFDMFFSRARNAATPVNGTDVFVKATFFVHELFDPSHTLKKTVRYKRKAVCPDCQGNGFKTAISSSCSDCGGKGTKPRTMHTPLGTIQNYETCPSCKGSGKAKTIPCTRCGETGGIPEDVEEILFITPPPDHDFSDTIRVKNHGNAGREGGADGDLIVEVEHDPTDRFTIERGYDIITKQNISWKQAIEGGNVSFLLPDGEHVLLPVRAGASEGERISFPGKGLHNVILGKRGDVYVDLRIVPPSKLSDSDLKIIVAVLEKYE